MEWTRIGETMTEPNWKQIATDLYESAGCSCCADYEERRKAHEAYRKAIKAKPPANRISSHRLTKQLRGNRKAWETENDYDFLGLNLGIFNKQSLD